MNESIGAKLSRAPAATLALVLWLATAVVGLWEIELIVRMMLRLASRFMPAGGNRYDNFKIVQMTGAVEILLVMALAIVWIAVVIGGAEYHRRRVGKPESWQLFGRVIAVEFGIVILSFFI